MSFTNIYIKSFDGLELHARDYNPLNDAEGVLPVIALPGLTRNSADFHKLADALSQSEKPRRVIAIDYRGRGLSDYDQKWQNYQIPVEMTDLNHMLAFLSIKQAIFIGTSRGGLITMAMKATQPNLIKAAVLNDIGPVIENAGLENIKSYVGKSPEFSNFEDAEVFLKNTMGEYFTALNDEEWTSFTKVTWKQKDGKIVLNYDPNISLTLKDLDLSKPIPPAWPLFNSLKDIPLLTLRGENSNLLSKQALDDMHKAHPTMQSITIKGQGHAPLLTSAEIIKSITVFCNQVDEVKKI